MSERCEYFCSGVDGIAETITSSFRSMNFKAEDIVNVNGLVSEKMKLIGWVTIELMNNYCALIRINDKEEVEEGFLMNNEEVCEIVGGIKVESINKIVDMENGVRFEGSCVNDTPFGFGALFDENGDVDYLGMVIDWNRMGFGTSFNKNGMREYEGYWSCNEKLGYGDLFDVEGDIIYEGDWYMGDRTEEYKGDGVNLHIRVKHLQLTDECILNGFDVSLFTLLEDLIIGDNCFCSVNTFVIDGLNYLRWIKIGKNSFTHLKSINYLDNDVASNPSRSFHVLNCVSLERLEIGPFSFSDCSGGFELKNLPLLSSIIIGDIASRSFNFRYSSFKVEDLPSLRTISLGNNTFRWTVSTVMSNLPNLATIKLGAYSLFGKGKDTPCSLVMKDLPRLKRITSRLSSYSSVHSVTLSNISNLERVILPRSFEYVETISITDVSPRLANLVKPTIKSQ